MRIDGEGKKGVKRLEEVKKLAGRMVHMHYCDNDVEGVIAMFAPRFLWLGTGEDEYLTDRESCEQAFRQLKGRIPQCSVWDEEYHAVQLSEDIYLVTGRMWIATNPSTRMYLKVHQRVSFVFRSTDEGLRCAHIHCSNPYQELMKDERFPEKIGRQSYEYVQERMTRLEEEMQRKNGLLASIYDTMPCGIIRFSRSPDGGYRFISANRAALALVGYDSMEEGMKDWHDGILGNVLKEDQDMLRKCFRELRQPGDRRDREYRVRWKDGSIHWMDGTNMVVGITTDGDSIIQRTLVDITQRKALRLQLDREQEMYRLAMEASEAVMFEYRMDADTFISYEPRPDMGVRRMELEHYSRVLLKGGIVHPEDVPIAIDNICKGRAESFEVRLITPGGKPGHYIWYRVNCRRIMEDGKPGRVVGALYNIHDMKSSLSERSERLYMNQSAFQAINGVYASVFYVDLLQDSYYAVRFPYAGTKEVLLRSGRFSSSLRRFILEHVNEADRSKVDSMCDRDWLLKSINQENEHMETEFRLSRQSGKASLWLRQEIHLVAMEHESPKTIIIAFRNISTEKQKELERREEERMAKLALEEAYAAANRANHAKSDFLSRMSHDIRTPMNAILGMTAVAGNHLGDDRKIADCLDKIRMSGNHLLGLINDVLDMSKIEAGSICLTEGIFCLRDIMKEVEQIIRPDTEHKGQHLTVQIVNLIHDRVCGDAVRVREILLNLLSNAVKYTQEHGHIRLALEEKLSDQGSVGCFEFLVEDDGIGMDPLFQEKMFQPFERASDTRISNIQGTGLGLSITKNLVQMMNGTIRVESQVNEGTRFVAAIYLKLDEQRNMDKGQADAGASERPAGDASREPAGDGAGELPAQKDSERLLPFKPGTRVLLAEDNELNREIARELLSLSGLTLTCAVNGWEAVEMFVREPPGTFALILMDIQMPVLDGYGAARAIRSMGKSGLRPDGAQIPIIALTANAFADDVYEASQAGMNAHVMKPLELDRLLDTMRRLIDPE